jgi:hypothetical protein
MDLQIVARFRALIASLPPADRLCLKSLLQAVRQGARPARSELRILENYLSNPSAPAPPSRPDGPSSSGSPDGPSLPSTESPPSEETETDSTPSTQPKPPLQNVGEEYS